MDDKDREAVEAFESVIAEVEGIRGENSGTRGSRRVLALAKRALRMKVVGWAPTIGGRVDLMGASSINMGAIEPRPGERLIPLYAEAPDE
jgi:hypothetical protein